MNNQFKFLDAYAPIFDTKYTYYVISGGRGSGKSWNIGCYFLMKLLQPEYFRGAIARYTQASLKKSIYQDILDMAELLGVTWQLNIAGDTISCKFNRNKIITHSMKIGDGAQQAKGKGISGITHLLIDEANEIKTEHEYIKLTDSIRTKGTERKIFVLFNPEAKSHWLHQRFFINGEPNPKWNRDHCFIHTTFRDNIELDPKKAIEYANYETLEPNRYKYEIQGIWHDFVEGQIYEKWEFVNEKPEQFENFVYGMDFGFNHPTALVKVWWTETELYIESMIYERGKQNNELISMMNDLGISKTTEIMCDYSRPEIISELSSNGFYAINADKTVKLGLDTVRSFKVYVKNDKNIQVEYENYHWKMVGDAATDEPHKTYDDAMDAIRYAAMRIKSDYLDYSPLFSF